MLSLLRGLLIVALGVVVAACEPAAAPTAQPTVPTPIATEEPSDEDATPTPESAAVNQTVAFTFYDSHAAWCGTCRANEPVLQALAQQFQGQIAFVRLDVDNPADTPTRQRFGLVDRSYYALVNAQGEVVKRWVGFLNEARIASELEALIAG
jgi:thioredoxin 1